MEFLLEILGRFASRIFSPRPVIRKEGGLLVIASSWRTALIGLGSRSRRVVIDPKAEVIRLQDRYLWLIRKSRRIEFSWVAEVSYCYNDLMDSLAFSHFSQDLFCVGLQLKDGSRLTLFRYFGQGEYVNQSMWPDWMMWDDFMVGKVAAHNQESESQMLVDTLCHLIKVPITNEL